MKKHVISLLVLFSVVFAQCYSSAQIYVDVSGSQIDVLGSDKIRVHQVIINGISGTYWADFMWDPHGLKFVPTVQGSENCLRAYFPMGRRTRQAQ